MKKQNLFGILRILMGFIFLWAFFDKLFGLGFSTTRAESWLLGGSPTYGFLSHSIGPFASFFSAIAGNIFVDWLFMLGLLLIGLALIFGIGMRIACYSGALMFFLMWIASIPPANNPIYDKHFIYIIALFILMEFDAGEYLGFGKKWERLNFVRRHKWLI